MRASWLFAACAAALCGCGGADTSSATGGGGGGASCEPNFKVMIDGAPYTSCEAFMHADPLNHVFSEDLEDGRYVIVNIDGAAPGAATCISVSLRADGSYKNDWDTGAAGCKATFSEYATEPGGLVTGTFSGTLSPMTEEAIGSPVLTDGWFSVPAP
jgi:hypothetical protein